MKRFLSLIAFLLVSFTFIAAQGNPWSSSANGNNNQGSSNSAWASQNVPQWLQNWLQNGGQIPPLLAAMVIYDARDWGMQNFGLTPVQMGVRYHQGALTIEFISTSPPSLTYRIKFGGISEIGILDEL